MTFHSNGQTAFSSSHTKGNEQDAGEEADEVAGGASGIELVRRVNDRL